MTELFYINVDNITPRKYDIILSLLPEERRVKAESYYFKKDKYLSAGAGYLLYRLLKDRGIDYSSAKIEIGKMGKPRLLGENVFFNLSHSGNIAVCAAGDGEVGVDAQKIRAVGDNVARRIFTDNEAAAYSALPEEEKRDFFFSVWAKKESVMKYFGLGFALPFKDIETTRLGTSAALVRGKKLYFKEYSLSGYKVCACSDNDEFSENLKEIVLY